MPTELTLTWVLLFDVLIGMAIGFAVRRILGRRTHLGLAASMLSGIVGALLGEAALLAATGSGPHSPVTALVPAVLGTTAVILVATQLSRPPERTPEQLLAGGEAADVEFKSTARRNLVTGERDPKIELVIAKTVAALANGSGGSLLIGVADDGSVLGLDADLDLMKQPDVDRYELWLRDYLSTSVGAAATTSLAVSFPIVSGRQICLVRVPQATRPVFVTPGKGDGPQLWVRIGNSTRQLPLDQALAYASDHFGRRGLRAR